MPDQEPTHAKGIVATVVGVLLLGAGHATGALEEFGGRIAHVVADEHVPPPRHLPPVPPTVTVPDVVKQSAQAFRGMKRGDPTEKLVAGVACALWTKAINASDREAGFEYEINQQLYDNGVDYDNPLVRRYVQKAARLWAVADSNGGGGTRYYVEYCVSVR